MNVDQVPQRRPSSRRPSVAGDELLRLCHIGQEIEALGKPLGIFLTSYRPCVLPEQAGLGHASLADFALEAFVVAAQKDFVAD